MKLLSGVSNEYDGRSTRSIKIRIETQYKNWRSWNVLRVEVLDPLK